MLYEKEQFLPLGYCMGLDVRLSRNVVCKSDGHT